MDLKEIIKSLWKDIAEQNADRLSGYFCENAIVNWHNTNECFTVLEYVRANCEYPGEWCGLVERIEVFGDLVISVTRVWLKDESSAFYATSFIEFLGDKIISLDEYWGDISTAPQWRLDKKIGIPITLERGVRDV